MSDTMNNDIINAILDGSHDEIMKISSAADEYVKRRRTEAESDCAERVGRIAESTREKAEDVRGKRATAARMERNKMLLAAKHESVSRVYELLLAALEKFDGNDFLALVEAAAGKYGEEGQTLILSSFAPVPATRVKALDCVANKKIKVESSDSLKSGFVLSGAAFDLDFTYPAIVESVRERTEREVVDELFGERV